MQVSWLLDKKVDFWQSYIEDTFTNYKNTYGNIRIDLFSGEEKYENKIPYIDGCDANFGIYRDRDLQIAKKLREEKLTKGFPETFMTNWAKVSSEKIIPLAKELTSVGLLKAVTLSLQSLDKNTLDTIKRANLKFNTFFNKFSFVC